MAAHRSLWWPVLAEKALSRRQVLTDHRKRYYELLHPETAHGGDRKSSRQLGDLIENRFTQDTADKTGRAERSVMRSGWPADMNCLLGQTI